MPPVNVTPDTLRQFYRGGLIPQSRIMTPSVLSGNNNSTGSVTNTTVVQSTTPGGGVKPTTPTAQTVSVSTPVLNPGDDYFAVATIAKTFDLISLTTSDVSRVRLYATAMSQSTDVSRGSDEAPPAGVDQGLILDVTLDTAPFYWLCTWVPTGVNGDSPRSSAIYVTVSNVDLASHPITATMMYLPTEA
jgi:hypothetical protein